MRAISGQPARIVILLVICMLSIPAAFAQDMWGKYCMWTIYGQQVCRATLEEVFEAYEEPFPYRRKWVATGDIRPGSSGTINMEFRTAYSPPAGVGEPHFSAGPSIPECEGRCMSEQPIIDYLVEQIRTGRDPDATYEVIGEYDPEFEYASTFELDFGSKRKLVITYDDGQSDVTYTLRKKQDYVCPEEAFPNSGWNIGKSPPGSNETEIAWGQLCGGSGPYTVTAGMYQRSTCAANANPCYPATAEKARFETDFVFAGRPFVRSYHSRRQAPMPGMAPGWALTYGGRIHRGLLGAVTQVNVVDDLGNIDSYKQGGDGKLHSIFHRNRTVAITDDGYLSRDQSGTYREFDEEGLLTRVRDPEHPERDVFVVHDPLGRITGLMDAQGRMAVFTYAGPEWDSLLSSVAFPDGAIVSYDYDSDRNLTRVNYPDGTSRQYLYAESELVPSGGKHLLSGIVDESGQRYASFGYDSRGRVVSSKLHAASGFVEVTELSYSGATATVTTDGAGTRAFSYLGGDSPPPWLIETIGEGNQQFNYIEGRVSRAKNAMGVWTSFAYSGSYLTQMVEAEGTPLERVTRFTNDADGNVTRMVIGDLSEGASRDIYSIDKAFNTRGQVVSQTETDLLSGETRTSARTYCEPLDVDADACPFVGLLLSVDGPRSDVIDVTAYRYFQDDAADCADPESCSYRSGDLRQVVDALGHVTDILRYDGNGRVLSVRDPNGVVVDYEYHPRGWLAAYKVRGDDDSTESDDRITRIEYWPTGLLRKITQPQGAYIEYVYDIAHRLVGMSDNTGGNVRFVLDAAGNRVSEEVLDSSGDLRFTALRIYNSLSQLQTSADSEANPTDFNYDIGNRVQTVVDPLGRVTDRDYDKLDRVIRLAEDADGVEAAASFDYDALDRIVRVTDPGGLVTGYTYNALGDLQQHQSPDSGLASHTYDSAGNLIGTVDAAGEVTARAYDALNRLISVTYDSPSLNANFSYDVLNNACADEEHFTVGRLARMDDASGSTQYCYDRGGHVARKIQVTAGRRFVTRYNYDNADRLKSIRYPSGHLVRYRTDQLGRPRKVELRLAGSDAEVDLLSHVVYAPFGPATVLTYGDGRKQRRILDLDYRVARVDDQSPDGLALKYGHDPVGNVVRLNSSGDNAVLARYGYDSLDRLVRVKDGPTGTVLEKYEYDLAGNRLSVKNSSGTRTYAYEEGSNRLDVVSGAGGNQRYAYDANGSLKSLRGDVERRFHYRDDGRMSKVLDGNGAVLMQYRYNARGERVRSFPDNESVAQTFFVYDESGRIIGIYGSAGTMIQEIVWLENLPVGVIVATESGPKVLQVQSDHLGTPRAVIDPWRQRAIWTWSPIGEAFGATPPNQDPDGDGEAFVFDLRFPGQIYDDASGLHYNYFRDYDPAIGRYVQSDPIGLAGGPNPYVYAGDNPIGFTDSSGLACDQRGCWVTPAEQAYADAGNYGLYYQAACAGGDPYACRAREVAMNQGFLSGVTNTRLASSILENTDAMTCAEAEVDMQDKMEAIRVALAKAHANALNSMGATRRNPVMLSRLSIANFHSAVFAKNGAGNVFGGNTWDKFMGWSGGMIYDWCPAPSCHP